MINHVLSEGRCFEAVVIFARHGHGARLPLRLLVLLVLDVVPVPIELRHDAEDDHVGAEETREHEERFVLKRGKGVRRM